MFSGFSFTLQIPALDRLMDYLEGKQQNQIDTLAAQVADLTASLAQHSSGLQGAVDNTK